MIGNKSFRYPGSIMSIYCGDDIIQHMLTLKTHTKKIRKEAKII